LYLSGIEYYAAEKESSEEERNRMTCSSCGAYVAPSVRFCSNCGAPASDPEITRIARLQSSALERGADADMEHVIFTVRPTLIFVKVGYALAALAGIVLVFLLSSLGVPLYISMPIAFAILLIPAYYHVKRNMIRYTVTDSKLEIDTGLIARTTRNIPLSKVQDVTVSASIPQRLMGFGDIVVDNASEVGSTIVMHNISTPRHYADLLLRELRRWH
jgi:membrane protein YdbS with pleckstrin-like domain